jgi:hypothetical protein
MWKHCHIYQRDALPRSDHSIHSDFILIPFQTVENYLLKFRSQTRTRLNISLSHKYTHTHTLTKRHMQDIHLCSWFKCTLIEQLEIYDSKWSSRLHELECTNREQNGEFAVSFVQRDMPRYLCFCCVWSYRAPCCHLLSQINWRHVRVLIIIWPSYSLIICHMSLFICRPD